MSRGRETGRGEKSGCKTSRPHHLKHNKGPQSVAGAGARRRQDMQQNPCSETTPGLPQPCFTSGHAHQALGGGKHLFPPHNRWFEAACAPSAGPRDRQLHLGRQTVVRKNPSASGGDPRPGRSTGGEHGWRSQSGRARGTSPTSPATAPSLRGG